MKLYLTSFVLVLAASACGRSVVAKKPESRDVNEAVTDMWEREIRAVAQDGDWILMRSYAMAGDVITLFTSGEDISHSAMYDARTGTIIEGVSPTVRESKLRDVIQHKRHIIVVRPRGLSKAQRRESVLRARSKIGAKYDWGGLVGVDTPEKFYCSELLYWASRIGPRHTRPLIVSPAKLIEYGEVVYWSGRRDDPEMRRAALAGRALRRQRRARITQDARVSM
jgi:uncharacterized protein YycO